MFYFSLAATGRWQLKFSPRSQNHSTWTIPSLVADRGGYHPHLLLCELTCIWSFFWRCIKAAYPWRWSLFVLTCYWPMVLKFALRSKVSNKSNMTWIEQENNTWFQSKIVLVPELLRYFHSGSETRAAPRWRVCGQPRKGHPRGSCRPEAWGGADWCSLWIL